LAETPIFGIRSITKVKKIQFGEFVEMLIKRNNSTVSEPCQCREIAIRPKFLNETGLYRVFHKPLIHSRGIQNETHAGFIPVSLVDIPRFFG
jgi:hypothetical protein